MKVDGRKKDKYENLIGRRYGRLVVSSFSGRTKFKHVEWNCLCDCGNTIKTTSQCLKRGNTKSCGCYNLDRIRERNFKHGFSSRENTHPMYSIWQGMKARCNIPSSSHWHRYGGRRIKVLWKDFQSFYDDMGKEFESVYKGKRSITIERKDNDGHYCKENCRWASDKEQANNKSTNHLLTYGDKTQTLTQWAEEVGSTQERIRARLKIGYSTKDALFSGVHKYRDETVKKMQATRFRVRLTFQGKTLTIKEWAQITGIRPQKIQDRYYRGWKTERILSI